MSIRVSRTALDGGAIEPPEKSSEYTLSRVCALAEPTDAQANMIATAAASRSVLLALLMIELLVSENQVIYCTSGSFGSASSTSMTPSPSVSVSSAG